MEAKSMVVVCLLFTKLNAQVFYTEGDIRLTGPQASPTQGILEIIHNNTWGTVCNDHFDMNDAQVVCRQLKHLPPKNITYLGTGTGPIWLDDVACAGTEQRLEHCQHSTPWGNTDCDHSQDVGIVCTPPTTPNPMTTAIPNNNASQVRPGYGNCASTPYPNIRLYGPSSSPGIGAVQVLRNNVWGGVCDNGGWGFNEAKVICRMLCYNDPIYAMAGSEPFDTSNISEPMTINAVKCVGNESHIDVCYQSPWSINGCGRNEMAKVTCGPMNNLPPISSLQPELNCSCCHMTAIFSKVGNPNLLENHLMVNGSQPCNVIKATYPTYINITIPFGECGTTRTMNSSHIIYSNFIYYVLSLNGIITTENTYGVQIYCDVWRNATDHKPIIPLTQTATERAPGYYKIVVHFFKNNTFETPVPLYPVHLLVGEWLNVAVELICVDPDLKIIVNHCFATPTTDRYNPLRYPLFTNKCRNDPTLGFFPINDTWSGFRYQTFKFIGPYNEVHIHCDAYICGNMETQEACDRSCFSGVGRRKRSVDLPVVHVSSPTIIIDVDSDVDINSPMNKETRPAPMKHVLILAVTLAMALISA